MGLILGFLNSRYLEFLLGFLYNVFSLYDFCHGLEIIDSHRQSYAFRRSTFRYSFMPAESKIMLPVCKVEIGVQTSHEMQQESAEEFICSSCKSIMQIEDNEANESSNLQLVPVDASESADKLKKQVPKVSSLESAQFPINGSD